MKTEEYISPQQKREVTEALEKMGATLPCARCGKSKFSIKGFQRVFIESTSETSDPYFRCVVIGCDNCGNIALHTTRRS